MSPLCSARPKNAVYTHPQPSFLPPTSSCWYTRMAATLAEELLFERLCKVDPTIPDTLLKYRHQLIIEGYDRFEHVLKTEEGSNYEFRMALLCVFDAKLIEFGLDPQMVKKYHQFVTFIPVCPSFFQLRGVMLHNCCSSLSASMERW